MRKIQCGDCGKIYDFDQDDFCPKCGAFNQPPRTASINAQGEVVSGSTVLRDGSVVRRDGSTIRRDGINEKNHRGSFLHQEFHAENRRRRGTSLAQGRGAVSRNRGTAADRKKPKIGTVLWWYVIGIIVLFKLLGFFII